MSKSSKPSKPKCVSPEAMKAFHDELWEKDPHAGSMEAFIW
jgi:hypothetical protein